MRAGLLSQFALTTLWVAFATHGFVANDALLHRAATRLAASDDVSASRRELASDDVSASRRELEARFGTGKPADPSKTMAFLKSKGLVGSDRGPAVASVVDEAGASVYSVRPHPAPHAPGSGFGSGCAADSRVGVNI